jgi:hypothetical protein
MLLFRGGALGSRGYWGKQGLRFLPRNLMISRLKTGMARRKRELLDILRDRPNGEVPDKKTSTRQTASAPSQSETSKPSTPASERSSQRLSSMSGAPKSSGRNWSALIGIGVSLAVVVLLGLKFWPLGPAEASNDDDGENNAALESDEPFAVLVAKYAYSPANKATAIASGRELRAQFPDLQTSVYLTKYPPDNPEIYELWIGASESQNELTDLLRQVQEATIETLPQNPRPFASAYIEQRRPIASN